MQVNAKSVRWWSVSSVDGACSAKFMQLSSSVGTARWRSEVPLPPSETVVTLENSSSSPRSTRFWSSSSSSGEVAAVSLAAATEDVGPSAGVASDVAFEAGDVEIPSAARVSVDPAVGSAAVGGVGSVVGAAVEVGPCDVGVAAVVVVAASAAVVVVDDVVVVVVDGCDEVVGF